MDEDSVLVSNNFLNRTIPELLRRSKNGGDCRSQEMEGDDLRRDRRGIGLVGYCPYYCKSALPALYSVCGCGECTRYISGFR